MSLVWRHVMRNVEHNLRRRARLEREAAELERKKAAQ